jgi:ribosomal protein S18 acetylase RimI-like enzyme
LVRAATEESDFAPLGRIVWEAFGTKLRFFLGDDPDHGASLFADVFAAGGLRSQALRVAVWDEAPSRPIGLCLLRFPGIAVANPTVLFRTARRRLGLWRGLRAFLGLLLCDGTTRPRTLGVSLLAVDPAWRNHGVGGALLRFAELEAHGARLERIALDVIANNPARRLYERHGFVVVRTYRLPAPTAHLFGYRAWDHMQKRLTR